MKLLIKKYGINGEGIAYDHKIPVFVPGALADEEVEVKVVENHGSYKVGELVKIYKRNPQRIKANCPYGKKCGACALLHADYNLQLDIKKAILEEALFKYADLDLDIDIVDSPIQEGYRNSLKMPVKMLKGKLYAGFYAPGSNYFVPIHDCMIHNEKLNQKLVEVMQILNRFKISDYNPKTKHGLRTVVLRLLDGKASLCLITGKDILSEELIAALRKDGHIASVNQSVNTSGGVSLFGNNIANLAGDKMLDFKMLGFDLKISVPSFLQLNLAAVSNLYEYVKTVVPTRNELIVEAYAGLGLMSFLLHDQAKEIIGIELIPAAVKNANVNAKNNKLKNVRFIAGDAAEMMKKEFKHRQIDTIIVDPPRSGLDDAMLESLLRAKIKNIIYVSCNGATLAKNIAVLSRRFKVESIKAFDLFPNTQHVECVCQLTRK